MVTGWRYQGGGGNGRPRRSCGAQTPVMTVVVQGLEDVGGGESGKGSAVPEGLQPGIRTPDLPECGRTRPEVELWPSHGGTSLRERSIYLGRRMHLLLHPSGRQMRTRAENIFAELRRAVTKPDKQVAHHNSWILMEMWRLVNKRVSTRREPGQEQRRLRRLGRAIQAALKEDRRRREATEVENVDVEGLLGRDPPLPHKAWSSMRGVVQRGGGPRLAARSNHTWADHGRERIITTYRR